MIYLFFKIFYKKRFHHLLIFQYIKKHFRKKWTWYLIATSKTWTMLSDSKLTLEINIWTAFWNSLWFPITCNQRSSLKNWELSQKWNLVLVWTIYIYLVRCESISFRLCRKELNKAKAHPAWIIKKKKFKNSTSYSDFSNHC